MISHSCWSYLFFILWYSRATVSIDLKPRLSCSYRVFNLFAVPICWANEHIVPVRFLGLIISDVNKNWRIKSKARTDDLAFQVEARTKELLTLWFINVLDKLYSISKNSQKSARQCNQSQCLLQNILKQQLGSFQYHPCGITQTSKTCC